jgi:predicted Zn-dependent peptidase
VRSTVIRSAAAALALLCAGRAPAQAPAAAAGQVQFEDYRLPNGLRVLLAPNPASPVVAVDVWYAVGSRDERPGRTGFAHLFEHMMFQGSANVGKGEHFQLVERAGGSENGSTTTDRTNYFEVLPANRLNLGLWLEADRMRSLAVTPENFTNQRDVVKEERRLQVENVPYRAASNSLVSDAVYDAAGCFGYAHPTYGSMDDLNAAPVDSVRAFHDLYYRPNNATLAVSGGFDPAEARRLVQEYFGNIPAGPAPPRAACDRPFTGFPLRRTYRDANAQLPAVLAVHGIPPAGSADFAALQLLTVVLGQGESSRLYERLVKRERAAVGVVPIIIGQQGPSLAGYGAIANQGVDPGRIEALLEEEVARVRDQGVTPAELEKAKNQLRASAAQERQTALGVAEALQTALFNHGDPGWVNRSLAAALAVTPADLQRVARQYLSPTNRALAVVQPAAAAPAPAPE